MIESGSGVRFVGDSIEAYRAGDVVLLGPGVPHTWCPAEGDEGGGSAEVLHVDAAAFSWPEFADIARLLGAADRGALFPNDAYDLVHADMARARAGEPAQRTIAMVTVLANLVRLAPRARPLSERAFRFPTGSRRHDESMRQVQTLCDFVNGHLGEVLVQSDVALSMGMSPAAFCRFLRRETGRTFTAYVRDVRLSEASRLLAETRLPITQIASTVGFRSLAHFNRCFRASNGTTPSAWRRLARLLVPPAAPVTR